MSINGFGEACKNIAASYLKVGDESTGKIRFQTTANLPHFSYICCKTEALGKEFNTVACSVIGNLIFIETNGCKERTKNIK